MLAFIKMFILLPHFTSAWTLPTGAAAPLAYPPSPTPTPTPATPLVIGTGKEIMA
jgi:hypothetical protein